MNSNDAVPFVDLVAPHRELKEELMEVFSDALDSASFVGGPMVEKFENDFARFCGTKHCIGVSSGTDALRFALIGVGVRPGDTVVTVPNTFIATTEAISQAGARPDFVDVDERTFSMDPAELWKYVTTKCVVDIRTGGVLTSDTGSKVTAVVPVHLYGQTADMDPILEIAEQYHLKVVEDACQAHGAEYWSEQEGRWRVAGSMGHAAAFSFYPGKNLGACGEAGAITTDDDDVARRARIFRDHGQAQKYYHEVEGYNGRLDAVQAGLLALKLPRLERWNASRRDAAVRYGEIFQRITDSVMLPSEPSWARSVYHLYVVRVHDRDELRRILADAGVGTGIHYPVPLHLQQAYSGRAFKAGDFPVAELVCGQILSLPMFPTITAEQQERVASATARFLGTRGKRAAA